MNEKVLKPMPKSQSELKSEAYHLGLGYGCNQSERLRNASKPRGKLLTYAYNSHRANRSFKHCTMLLLGSSGVGKSSAINHLLNADIASISNEASETRRTTEFKKSIAVPRFAVSDLSLGIVDTPGFNDTDGLAQDACNLASVSKFCHNYFGSKIYPNVILLCIQATDNRFMGHQSSFSKTLRAISKLNIVDRAVPNVVVVITWACAISHKNVSKWKATLTEKGRKVNEILSETLGVTAPVVWLENNFEDEELEVDGDFTKLPDGQLQPRNLYQTIIELFQKNKDDLGLITVKEIFCLSTKKLNFEKGLCVLAKEASRKQLDSKETELYNTIQTLNTSEANLCRVTTAINGYLEENKNLTEAERNEALDISTDLVVKLGFTDPNQISQYTVGMLSQLLQGPLSPFGEAMLEEVFKLSDEMEMPEAFLCVGKGYNILNDDTRPSAIFQTTDGGIGNCCGVNLPPGISLKKVKESITFMEEYETEEKYVGNRLRHLNINFDVDYKIFSMKTRGGFNRTKGINGKSSSTEKSFLLERRLFHLEMADLKNPNLKLTKSFTDSVNERLPTAYDKNNPNNRAEYEDFFNTWGHFVVASAYGGGSVEAKVNIFKTSNSDEDVLEISAQLDAAFRGLTTGFHIGIDGGSKGSQVFERKFSLATNSLKWVGGDTNLHCMAIEDIDPDKWKLWLSSLAKNPSVLTTDMSLLPIHNIVDLVNPSKVTGCCSAMTDLLGGEFKVKKTFEKAKEDERKKQEEDFNKNVLNRRDEQDTQDPISTNCFPGNSNVFIRDQFSQMKSIKMSNLEVGMNVLTSTLDGNLKFSKVFMFNHHNKSDQVQYLKVIYGERSDEYMLLTWNHVIMTKKMGSPKIHHNLAHNLEEGHFVLVFDPVQKTFNWKVVTQITRKIEKGYFAPMTLDGSVVVNNVWASCYCDVQPFKLLGYELDSHQVAHFGMMPFRMMYMLKIGNKYLGIKKDEDMPIAIKWAVRNMLPYVAK